jgi:hypothetical protein
MPGTQWVPADIVDVIDKYGDIKEVSLRRDIRGEQYAVVHFNEWYPEGMRISTAVQLGKPVKIRALYRKTFNLIMFNKPLANKPLANKPSANKPSATKRKFVPIAPGLSFGNPGQLSAAEYAARRPRADSNVSDVTMEDDFANNYALEEGEVI